MSPGRTVLQNSFKKSQSMLRQWGIDLPRRSWNCWISSKSVDYVAEYVRVSNATAVSFSGCTTLAAAYPEWVCTSCLYYDICCRQPCSECFPSWHSATTLCAWRGLQVIFECFVDIVCLWHIFLSLMGSHLLSIWSIWQVFYSRIFFLLCVMIKFGNDHDSSCHDWT